MRCPQDEVQKRLRSAVENGSDKLATYLATNAFMWAEAMRWETDRHEVGDRAAAFSDFPWMPGEWWVLENGGVKARFLYQKDKSLPQGAARADQGNRR